MGPSKDDPSRQVGTFNTSFVSTLPALRLAQMEKFKWLDGDWLAENRVPETSKNPAYIEHEIGRFRVCEKGNWICIVGRDGRAKPHITFDPFSNQWMYVLTEGAYGVLRSPGWNGAEIQFTGWMTMIGVSCEWRMTWHKISDDAFFFVNEEKLPDGNWGLIDEWHYRRQPAA